jgi:thymidylate synthase
MINTRKIRLVLMLVQFTIINNELCMSVYMRSNDIWYGFCNDQYQFSSLQKMIARQTEFKNWLVLPPRT